MSEVDRDWQLIDTALGLGMQAWRSSQPEHFDLAFQAMENRLREERRLNEEILSLQEPGKATLELYCSRLENALHGALRVATWMSGSVDFARGGIGFLGFSKMSPTLDEARAVLKEGRP